ncbi:hypothetical protein UFOVP257_427 [uncultured Caudovirales phage]|uniref:Uncharacterized protein n=1 Tax=uncultured Caudovirales phage TaxID=2100421 RepID=A0A6J5LHM9_9CAUD|nr:hypothetical protein UFOVP257_427 [uncultured Caudovirales phage]
MSTQIIDVADLDCIFLTYDEPKKEEFWIKIQNMVPWAKRVDGVKGSDAAHKAAAATSDTEWFILIDGDNIPDPEFFNLQLKITPEHEGGAFRWKARNTINGLRYGNGGMSCWSKKFVNSMRTHEASDGSDETAVEFCFDPKYFAMHNCYSTTYPNGTPKQAWRAGFREGVKMCLDRGHKPTLTEFEEKINNRNYDHLCIWQSVGADVEHGYWAMYGARLGTFMIMIEGWDHHQVQDFDMLNTLWESFGTEDPVAGCVNIENSLKIKLGLPIVTYTPEQSRFFKHHYSSGQRNSEIMMTEMDVIRKLEGW